MPLFGAQMSIAGGLHKALKGAQAEGMDSVQIFTGSPRSWPFAPTRDAQSPWQAKELRAEDVAEFKKVLKQTRLRSPLAHDCYLINLAAPAEELFRQSLEAFVIEMQRAEALGLAYLVMHPGTATDGHETAGLQRIARALDEVHARCPGYKVKVLLETTAGQGLTLGHRFEHLAEILAQVAEPERLGVCLDTCHVFAAGYALAPEKEYRATFTEFDRVLGLKNLKAFHINDSVKPQGSRVDRHAHIGQGCLGLEPFRLLVNDSRFRKHPMILETPKEGGDNLDAMNLATLRGLAEA